MNPLRIQFVGELPKQKTDRSLEVASDADYLKAVASLREGVAVDQDVIWVRQEHHFRWLSNLVEQCPSLAARSIEFDRATARTLMAQHWERELPSWLTDREILDHNLLETELSAEGDDVCRALLHPIMGALPKGFPPKKTGFLAQKLSDPATMKELQNEIMASSWQEVMKQWQDQPDSLPWQAAYLKRLQQDPKSLWDDLTTWSLLCNYPPQVQEYALSPAAVLLVRSIPSNALQAMGQSRAGAETARDQITQFFDQVNADAKGLPLATLIGFVSGQLVHEFDCLEKLLSRRSNEVTAAIVQEVKRRFKGCPGLTQSRIAALDQWVEPTRPELLDDSTDAAAWVRWAKERYFDYRWWQIQHDVVDPDLERAVANFSQWYAANYSTVHADPSMSAVQRLSQWRESISQDTLSLILMVDNLPFFFWSILEEALQAAGMYCHQSDAVFVPLPSVTAISKPQIVSGEPDASGSDYLKLLKRQSAHSWDSREVTYLTGLHQLQEIQPDFQKPSVLLMNYLAADEALHEDRNHTGISWQEQLSLLFRKLAEGVAEFAREAREAGQKVSVYVLTDHGATLILPSERKEAESQLTKNLFPNEKYRSASMTLEEAATVPENLWILGTRFSSPLAPGQIHFIPRGHATVANAKNGRFFSHGGATPEEVIVPCGIFRLYRAERALPQIRFTHFQEGTEAPKWYVKRIVTLEVELMNPNPETCEIHSVKFEPAVGEIRGFEPTSLSAKSTKLIPLSLYFGNEATQQESLTFSFQFHFGQDSIEKTIEIPVSIHSAMSGGLNLNDL